MSYAIQAQGLVKRFGETTALAGVDLAARTGTVLAVLGPNGAGKITAVRILATLLRPDQGRATVAGYDVVTQAHQVRQLIALTGQYAAVDESLTGVENLLLIGRLLGLSRPEARRRAAELLEELALADDVVVIDHRRVVATGHPATAERRGRARGRAVAAQAQPRRGLLRPHRPPHQRRRRRCPGRHGSRAAAAKSASAASASAGPRHSASASRSMLAARRGSRRSSSRPARARFSNRTASTASGSSASR